MAHYIAIERVTGRVYGDTARFGQVGDVASPEAAVLLFDRHHGRAPRGFGHVGPASTAASYDVYEIRSSGSRVPTANEAEAQALVKDHGSWVVALVSYNSLCAYDPASDRVTRRARSALAPTDSDAITSKSASGSSHFKPTPMCQA